MVVGENVGRLDGAAVAGCLLGAAVLGDTVGCLDGCGMDETNKIVSYTPVCGIQGDVTHRTSQRTLGWRCCADVNVYTLLAPRLEE